ncbi:MAG TPA: hypothetical protein VNJ51_07565 [Candidatus Dormibacteraeota bacterium]|nr:hypothetical protein [Candidatus Dormibacteraeota bacterium]
MFCGIPAEEDSEEGEAGSEEGEAGEEGAADFEPLDDGAEDELDEPEPQPAAMSETITNAKLASPRIDVCLVVGANVSPLHYG